MKIDWTSKTVVQELQAWMDGGSLTLICTNSHGQNFTIEFVQNVHWEVSNLSRLPGRLYLNNELIEQRSILENALLENLEKSTLAKPHSLEKKILSEKIHYVKSKKYLTDPTKLKLKERKTTPNNS